MRVRAASPSPIRSVRRGPTRRATSSQRYVIRVLVGVVVGIALCAAATGCSFNVNVGKGADVEAYRATLLNALRDYGNANKKVDESTCAGDVMVQKCQDAAATFCDAVGDFSSIAKETEPPAQLREKHAELVQLTSGYVSSCNAAEEGFRARDAATVQAAIGEISDWHLKLGYAMEELGVVTQ